MEWPLVSIVIVCEQWNPFLAEALPHYRHLDYPHFEILVFSSQPIRRAFPRVRFIAHAASRHQPARKRDLVLKYGRGEIFAFIDDDAYPSRQWLKKAVANFRHPEVVAVGGPGLNPVKIGVSEAAAGWISASPLGGWGQQYRFYPQRKREVDDYPSFNLLVRAETFRRVGGFQSAYYPGEDTKLCLDLVKTGGKILYEPAAIVYHHKRPLFRRFLIQNGRFGFHRGHFARILPQNSRRWFYFVPPLFSLGLCLGLGFWLLPSRWLFLFWLRKLYLGIILFYLFLLVLNSFWVFYRTRRLILAALTIPGVFLNHFYYGLQFIRGYFSHGTVDNYGRSE